MKINVFALRQAASWINAGGVIAHATEGVWGLACNPLDSKAVARLLALKNRREDQGLILIGASSEMFSKQLAGLNARSRQTVCDTWPGAHTWLLPDHAYPDQITGGRKTLAARVPAHVQARQLCACVGHPLVSTSANISGRSPAYSQLQVRSVFGRRIDFYLAGELAPGELRNVSKITDAMSLKTIREAN